MASILSRPQCVNLILTDERSSIDPWPIHGLICQCRIRTLLSDTSCCGPGELQIFSILTSDWNNAKNSERSAFFYNNKQLHNVRWNSRTITTIVANSWWRHQMETISALLAICAGNSPVSGEFPAQRPVTRSFDVFFDLRMDGRLSKHSWSWWLDTLSCPLWRQSNGTLTNWQNQNDTQICKNCSWFGGHNGYFVSIKLRNDIFLVSDQRMRTGTWEVGDILAFRKKTCNYAINLTHTFFTKECNSHHKITSFLLNNVKYFIPDINMWVYSVGKEWKGKVDTCM